MSKPKINEALQDDRLSWKALGLLTYLLSLRNPSEADMRCNNTGRPDGKDSTASGLKELKRLGYIKKTAIRDDNGRVTRWKTEVFASPQNTDKPESSIS